MLNRQKIYDLFKPTPSGYYANWPEIEADMRGDKPRTAGAARAADVAARLARALMSKTPPRKIWDGVPSWLFRWVLPFLPVAWLDWLLVKSARGVRLVQAPE